MGMKSQMGTGIVKLWAMVACVVALLAAVSGAARAGQWSQYDPTGNIPWWQNPTAAGQTVMSGYAIMDGFDFNGIWPWDVYPSGDPTLSDIYEGQPQLATAGRYTTVANGTETFTFYWTHGNGYNDTNDPAPSTASFIVTSALYLNAVADPFTFALSHFIVDDCFGADVIPILDSLPNLGVSISAVHPYLVTVPVQDNKAIVKTKPINYGYSVTVPPVVSGIQTLDHSVYITAAPDTRTVAIGPTTNYMGPPTGAEPAMDTWKNPLYYPTPHKPDSIGNILGDIGVPDVLGPGPVGPPPPASNLVNYHATLHGPWTIPGMSYAWSSSTMGFGGNESDTIPTNANDIDISLPFIPDFTVYYLSAHVDAYGTVTDPGSTSKTDNVNLSVTDGVDGATEKSTYKMTVHRPFDSPRKANGPSGTHPWHGVPIDVQTHFIQATIDAFPINTAYGTGNAPLIFLDDGGASWSRIPSGTTLRAAAVLKGDLTEILFDSAALAAEDMPLLSECLEVAKTSILAAEEGEEKKYIDLARIIRV